MSKTQLVTTLFSATLLLTACGSDSTSNLEPADSSSSLNETSLSDIEVEGLLFRREEEELARDLYLDLYDAKG